MKFFYPDGRKIEGDQDVAVEKFRSFYSGVYHYENWDAVIPERLIQGILSSDALAEDDVVSILKWKTGINAYDEKAETLKARHPIDIRDVCKKLPFDGLDLDSKGTARKRVLSYADAKALIENLMNVCGIGATYALTLLYFMSKGAYPIYDQFAHRALIAVREDREIGAVVSDADLRADVALDKAVSSWFDNYVCCFKGAIDEMFGYENYVLCRSYDQALWAYGHMFRKARK